MASSDDSRLDPAAVAALYVQYADDLRAFLTGVLRSGDLAAEALQATFARALERGHTARSETIKGWLFRVAFNEAMALRRRRKLDETSARKLAWERPDRDDSPDVDAIRWELVERVRKTLDTLPPDQRRVVHMRIYEGKTFAAIAAELHAPLGTILTRMQLALRKLERRLETDDPR